MGMTAYKRAPEALRYHKITIAIVVKYCSVVNTELQLFHSSKYTSA
jgi:hypothetical protein